MCRFRVNGKPIRRIFRRFQNVPASCERSLSLSRRADKNLATFYLKVVPLSQRSGIVEWCENTVPLGEYLVGIRGIGGAHSKYHPTDWAAAECRKKFSVRKNRNLHLEN